MTKEIGVMGNQDFVLGFNLAGVRRTYVTDGQTFPREIERVLVAPENLGILIVEAESLGNLTPHVRRKATESLEPVVIAMGEGAGENDLREKVKRAIGIDLYK